VRSRRVLYERSVFDRLFAIDVSFWNPWEALFVPMLSTSGYRAGI
jgi:hypothetical protein